MTQYDIEGSILPQVREGLVKQAARYVLAVLIAFVVTEIVGVMLAILIDIIVGDQVTGGRWVFNTPNVVLVVCKGLVAGYLAAVIAGKHGKLLGAVTAFFPLSAILAVSIAINRDILSSASQSLDTKPALWSWIALVPAIVGGHFGVKLGQKSVQVLVAAIAGVAMVCFYVGSTAFHVYTILLAYEAAGFLAAFITAGAPPIAELYWAVRLWRDSGSFINQYDILLLLLLGLLLTAGTMFALAATIEERRTARLTAAGPTNT